MKRIVFIATTLFLLTSGLYSSRFDEINWQLNVEKRGVKLYTGRDNSFIKVEALYDFSDPQQVVNCLMDFDIYLQLYPKTLTFEPVARTEDETLLIYVVVNFFPMKNRAYMIKLKSYKESERYIIEWNPPQPGEFENRIPIVPDILNVEKIQGRWIIEKRDEEKVFISIEMNNDWKIDLSRAIIFPVEREEAIKTVKSLTNYLGKLKKDK